VDDETAKLASELVRAAPIEFAAVLQKFRDTKGSEYTKALTAAVHRLDGDRKRQARDALAERLTRMTADTLRTMLKGEDAELRRGAALACAMKDDKTHVPDLIDRITDADDLVVRAAKAGLKSLTAQDFGPQPGATEAQKKTAADAWKAWWAKQKK
jgi:HEAT repeat protein